ncbi:MAG: type IV conjugative transfer system protein TraL [Gammaproteobacteria bacterium]
MRESVIPQYLHQPTRVLFLDADEFGVLGFSFLLAAIFGGMFWILLLVGPMTYIELKRGKPRGFLRHFFAKEGFPPLPEESYPPSTVRVFHE